MVMYVDDTTLLRDLNNDNNTEILINDVLCTTITNWLLANQICMNDTKLRYDLS